MPTLLNEVWRDLWSIKVDMIVASLSYVFATTNFLNLPLLILENGGLAFVAAYCTSLLVCVLPILVLEFSMGQLTGKAPIRAFYNICPIFKGIGVAQMIFSLLIMSHMARYVGWLMLYLFHLFWAIIVDRPDPGWPVANPWIIYHHICAILVQIVIMYYKLQLLNPISLGLPWLICKGYPELHSTTCREAGTLSNISYLTTSRLGTINAQSSLVQFMRALERPSENIAEVGEFQIYILTAMGAVWIIIFLSICFGIRWLGKIVHFTFIMPVVLLSLTMVRALTLRGLVEILEKFYRATDWNRMKDYMLWKTAAEQSIMATGIGFGVFITIGSYNKQSNNIIGDCLIIIFGHLLLTTMQVLTVIGFVGHISARTGFHPISLLERGEAQMWHVLAYMSYLPDTRIWTSIVLFLSIFILLNVFYLLSLNVLACFEDSCGDRWSKCFPRFILALFICCIGFSTGLYFATQGGYYAYELVGGYWKYVTLWAILFFELLAVGWFYCAYKLGKDVRVMVSGGFSGFLGCFFMLFVYFLPAVPLFIAVINLMNYDYSIFSSGIHEWKYSEIVGWVVALAPLLPIPFFMQFMLCRICIKGPGVTKWQRFKNALSSPLHIDVLETSWSSPAPRYTSSAPGYILLPQAPLAEPEVYNEAGRSKRNQMHELDSYR